MKFILGFLLLCSLSAPAEDMGISAPYLVTKENRITSGMFGGWGHHLRGLLRMSDNSLWMAADLTVPGTSTHENKALGYFKWNGTAWDKIKTLTLPVGIQQNMAQVTDGNLILSYGIDTTNNYLIECYLVTTQPKNNYCNAMYANGSIIRPSGNYIGTSISKGGKRLVWWTTVGKGANGSQGTFNYVYGTSGAWSAPVKINLEAYNIFEYVYARFIGEDQIALSGNFWLGNYPAGESRAAVTKFKLGAVAPGFYVLANNTGSYYKYAIGGSDIHVDKSGGLHVLAEDGSASLSYYYLSPQTAWPAPAGSQLLPTNTFPSVFRARFTELASGSFYLILGGLYNSRIEFLRFPTAPSSGPLDFSVAQKDKIQFYLAQGWESFSGLWTESASYQTTPVKGLNIAYCGAYSNDPALRKDGHIYFNYRTLPETN